MLAHDLTRLSGTHILCDYQISRSSKVHNVQPLPYVGVSVSVSKKDHKRDMLKIDVDSTDQWV